MVDNFVGKHFLKGHRGSVHACTPVSILSLDMIFDKFVLK